MCAFFNLVPGLIILNAHKVTETSGDGFAVRLYRQGTGQGLELGQTTAGNSRGYLRAFSDNPNAFASGFNKIEKVGVREDTYNTSNAAVEMIPGSGSRPASC